MLKTRTYMKTFLHHILDYGDILLLLVAFFAPNPRKFPGVCALRNDGEQGPFSRGKWVKHTVAKATAGMQ